MAPCVHQAPINDLLLLSRAVCAPGLAAGPGQGQRSIWQGRDGCQRGEGMADQGRERQSPLGAQSPPEPQQQLQGLILSIPEEPTAAEDK